MGGNNGIANITEGVERRWKMNDTVGLILIGLFLIGLLYYIQGWLDE